MHAERTYLPLVIKIGQLNLVVLCLLHIVMASPQVYKPWMERHPAKVLSLSCEAPSDISESSDFGKLELYGPFQNESSIETTQKLAAITEQMTSEGKHPDKYLPDISRVNFTGNWKKSTARLSVHMPFKSGTYNCTYKRSGYDKIYLLSVRVEEFRERPIENDTFRVEITKAQMVSVTWKPTNKTFQEARVCQRSVDNSGEDKEAAMTVFTTIAWNAIYSDSVLLHRFEDSAKNGNYSILLYVDEKLCRPKCRYSCFVTYPSCVQDDAHLCECSQAVTEEPNSECEYEVEFIAVTVILIVLVVLIIIPVVIFCVRYQRNKSISFFCMEIKRKEDRNLNGPGTNRNNGNVNDVVNPPQPEVNPLLAPTENPNRQGDIQAQEQTYRHAGNIVHPPQQPEEPDDRDVNPGDGIERAPVPPVE